MATPSHDDLRRFLVRAVLDDGFRELARTDPDRAMEGFDLTDEQRDALRRQEADLLGLLGQTLHAAGVRASPAEPAPAEEAVPAPEAAELSTTIDVSSLREMRLMLRLVPAPVRNAAGEVEVRYAASLHPLPVESGSEGGAPAQDSAAPPPAPDIDAAAKAVRDAAAQDRVDRLVDLARAVRGKAPQ